MKSVWHLCLVLALFLSGVSALAQDSTTQTLRDGQVLVPERPTAMDSAISSTATVRPLRPERPDLPPQVRARIDRFKLDARAFLSQQEALKKKMVGANEQDRAALREQLRLLRERWLEQTRERRLQTEERKRELEIKLKDHRKLLDEVRGSIRDQRQELLGTGGDPGRKGLD